jgi:hypothetical protein
MDQIVYDMSSQSEAEPNIFIKKDWISILDNQNGIYSSNQCVVDTSQLSNSNKYMNYREGYFTIPMLLTLTQSSNTVNFTPAAVGNSCDYALSLKNWYGSIIHSISVDLAGTTIIQQTPFQSLWNTFKLMTTLSYQDLLTIGPSIGFYPDNSASWVYTPNSMAAATVNISGIGVTNNHNFFTTPVVSGAFNSMEITNNGMYQRQKAWNFNTLGYTGASSALSGQFSALLSSTSVNLVYKSSVIPAVSGTASVRGYWQAQIVGTVLLRHLHSFFDKMPLCKGVFMKITMNLNNTIVNNSVLGVAGAPLSSQSQALSGCSFPMGGINPIMFASGAASNGMATVIPTATTVSLFASIYVGATCYEANAVSASAPKGYVNNVTLNVPSYTFNPVYEQAYLSNPVRKIDYSDIYQYQALGVKASGTFNQLVTNGIAGIKSVLVLPFHSAAATVNNLISPLQSCFDPAGGGTTSPLTLLNNFNVVISGQNAIYNSERYSYEQFLNQLIGQNGVNGNQLDGVSSGLVSQFDFENSYNYYFVNVERCLPIEKGVSKSVSITGTNVNAVDLDLYIFVEYGVSIQLNLLTGGRV